ncbi:MAG: putative Ig domain-containing protein [Verrucomicrobiaceae bacterium]|nr:putative Ig domain-containing protein [Verrucomicrobiaceae bacterium]
MTVTLPSTSATVGTVYSQSVTQSGSAATPITYTLNSGSLPTWATLTAAGVLSGTPNNTTAATFTIRATDANGCFGISPSYTITPACPTITVTAGSAFQPVFGTASTQTTGASASGISGTFTWSLTGTIPTGLTINSSTGQLSTTAATPAGLHNSFNIVATSASYPTCSGSLPGSLRVCPVMTVTLPSTSATVGTVYSQSVTQSGSAATPITYTLNSGALPTWATLTAAGVLSGTPNTTTAATFTIRATDANGCFGISPSYTITPACPTITVTAGSAFQPVFGTASTQTTGASASGISGTFTWSLTGTIPTGLTINGSGQLSTTAATPAGLHSSFNIVATSASYPTCSGSLPGSLRVCPVMTVTLPNTSATVGTVYSQSVTQSGSAATPITYTLNSGSLPTWATLTAAGVLSGTPNNTTAATFTIRATDANGCFGISPSYTITPACPTITVTAGSAFQPVFGTASTQTTGASASGISGTFTWSLTGMIPTGLTINGSVNSPPLPRHPQACTAASTSWRRVRAIQLARAHCLDRCAFAQ